MNDMKETLPRTKSPQTNGADHSAGPESLTSAETVATPHYAPEDDIEITIPRRRRWPFVALGLLALTVVAGLLYFIFFQPTSSVQTARVRRGVIISTVETTGKLVTENNAQLSFRASGPVEKIYARQGDPVKAGEVLAELDTSDLKRQVQQAQTQLQIAQLNLEKGKQGPSRQDLAAAQAQLDGALAQLKQVKAGSSPEDISAAQATLAQAQSKLAALKKGASPQDVAAAQSKLDEARANRELVANTAHNNTEQARITYDQAAKATQDWLDPTGQLEQARLNYETAQKNEQSQVAIADAQVNQAQQALDKLKAGPSADDVNQAQQAVNQAQANLDKLKKGPTAEDIAQAQSKVDVAQANLDKLKAGPGEADLAISQQQVNLAQLGVDNAQAQLANAQIISPLDGALLSINLEVGQVAGALQPVATVADLNSLRVQADVDEIDVGRVSPGQPVTMTLDAYPGVKIPGKIESLAPGATQKQGSTVYQATIGFTAPGGVTPREGMAANVTITAQRKDNVLLLPNRALESVANRQYVTLRENGVTRKIEVETGLSNDTDTEIISGLSEGQTVVLR